jgi:hypothetical protein
MLGTQRVDAQQVGYEKIANKLTKYKIDGLLIIGGIILKDKADKIINNKKKKGFEAFASVLQLSEQRLNFNEFKIPLICIPGKY